MGKLIFADPTRCFYCHSCEIACAREHGGYSCISVAIINERHSLPLSCRHCQKAPCVTICSVKAFRRNEQGIYLIDPAKCNGCQFCIMVCPFGFPKLNLVRKVITICDLCQSRLQEGKLPACVSTCPSGALMYEEFEAPLVPCKDACPAGIDIPRYIHFIHEGKYSEAVAVIREKVPFPNVLGRVCHHPCETACRRGEVDGEVSINALKRFVAEKDTGLWKKRAKKAPKTGKKVAIVGSGPAGLTTAYYLSKLGHSVTIFEALPFVGGMMRVGIPSYRLPRQVLQKDIEEILSQEIELKVNTPIGNGLTLAELKNQGYQAIFLAVGAQLSRKIKIDGVDLEGVLWGLDFLREVNLGQEVKVRERVLVIGGGNVAIDVALTALRLGAKEVQLACLESRAEMPGFEWGIQEALEEGIVLNVSWGPKRILGTNGEVTGIELIRCTSVFDQQGKFNPSFDESVTKTIDADMVILAIGQAVDLSFLGEGSEVKSIGGVIRVKDNLATDAEGVFAGGDAVIGPASVVEAVAAGRRAATSIDRYLGGSGIIDEVLAPMGEPKVEREDNFPSLPRHVVPCLPVEQRLGSFDEIEYSYDEETTIAESRRCLHCDLRLSPGFLWKSLIKQ